MLERQVRLFRNGRNQAVRIPRSFELSGNEAILRKEGIAWCWNRSQSNPCLRCFTHGKAQ